MVGFHQFKQTIGSLETSSAMPVTNFAPSRAVFLARKDAKKKGNLPRPNAVNGYVIFSCVRPHTHQYRYDHLC